ncbi:hypothetical protein [Herpetosiphon geysericola]|uniref:PLL-like beta propeller domain-containing protein n=1 Tax=Herpetosiphon geysericola TaxID=70996 RepID=A0A0N8GSZ4_9CHLR|nr:hypothetical protein [Herpetosiphon geysericola]KPL90666.1 hypothetical protein SE18_06285 [Herpetosiphon geysericola]
MIARWRLLGWLVSGLMFLPFTVSAASPHDLTIAPSGSISCATPSSERIDCFVLGDDKQVWQRSWQSSAGWGNWQGLGLSQFSLDLGGGVSAITRSSTSLDIFVSGKQGSFINLYQRTWDGTSWSSWNSLGGPGTADIYETSCTSASATSIQCFARTSDNHLWQKVWNGSTWTVWSDLGAFISVGPFKGLAAVNYGSDNVMIYAIGSDGHAYRRFYEGGTWFDWVDDGNPSSSLLHQTSCHRQASNALSCTFSDTAGAVWVRTWESGGWSSFMMLAELPSAATGVAIAHYLDTGTMVIANASNGKLYRTFRNDATSAWTSWIDDGRPQDLQIFIPIAQKPN